MKVETTATERVRTFYQRTARSYETWASVFERVMLDDDRRWICSKAEGDVLEIAIGTGRNLSFYPPAVRLTAVDLSPAMLAIAQKRATQLARPVALALADAEGLPFQNCAFDTVVCTLSLCAIPDERRAIAEGQASVASARPLSGVGTRAQSESSGSSRAAITETADG